MKISFNKIRNIGLLLIVFVIILVGLIPGLIMARIAKPNALIAEELRDLEKTAKIYSLFEEGRDGFERFIRKENNDIIPTINILNKCISESEILENIVNQRNNIEYLNIIKRFKYNVKRFKTAVFSYSEEEKYDFSGLSASPMLTLAVDSVKYTQRALLALMESVYKNVEDAKKVMNNVFKEGQIISIAGLVFGLLMSLLFFLIMARSLKKPIAELLKATQRIAYGELDYRIEVETEDELGLLASSFNKMAEDLTVSMEKEKELISEKAKAEVERQKAKELASAYEEVKKAKELAEKANKAKTQFLANMSHEIRTPLNAIIGFLDLLKETSLNEQQKGYVGTTLVSGKLLVEIINDIVDISRIESGELKLQYTEFNLEELIEDLLCVIKARILGEHIILYSDIQKEVPINLIGDPIRLRQILINLLTNAVNSTEQGEISIGVMLEKRLPGSENVIKFVVKDTGKGLSEDKKSTIFDMHEEIDSSEESSLIGIGLSICKSYVKLMGGEIWVLSTLGKGSEFSFTAKLKESSAGAGKRASSIYDKNLKGKLVLIVEDKQKDREMLCSICDELEMEFFGISASLDALDWLEERVKKKQALPDIVFIDLEMSEMDGYELISKIKPKKQIKKTKFAAISFHREVGIAKKAKDAGFDIFFPKPIIKRELIKVINTVLIQVSDKIEIEKEGVVEELVCKDIRVLVAEDNLVNQELIGIFLKNLGCAVELVSNGQEAINKIKQNENGYDVILMDIMMPIMGGFEAVRIIRNEISIDLPVIALTAAAMEEDEKKCLSAGMNDYISKPIQREILKDKLLKWGKKRG